MIDEEKAIQKKSNEYLLDHFTQTFRDCVHLEKENAELKKEIEKRSIYEKHIEFENKQLEKQNAELKQKLESDELALNEASEIIAELKMKLLTLENKEQVVATTVSN